MPDEMMLFKKKKNRDWVQDMSTFSCIPTFANLNKAFAMRQSDLYINSTLKKDSG